jgi:hypothetical protein
MYSKDDINSILKAVNEINSKPKKKTTHTSATQISIPKLNQNLPIPSDIDLLISEAEKHQKKTLPILPNNTNVQKQKNKEQNHGVLILTDEVEENSNNYIKSIELKNIQINVLKEAENNLRNKIINLEQEKIISLKANKKIDEVTNYEDFKKNTKENLQSIYKQVEKQKQLFLDLKNYSTKIERDSNVYKENYERLIIENNELKTRLKLTKEKISNYEDNKKNLLTALDQLNEIISKNNIVGISPQKSSIEKFDLKEVSKIEPIDKL